MYGALLYFALCNWLQITYLLANLIKQHNTPFPYANRNLILKMRKKTHLPLVIHVMNEKHKMIGFMVSSPPFKPLMLFSKKLVEVFSDDEMQWVILHESGHYLMWHNLKFAVSQILIFIFIVYLSVVFHWNLFFLTGSLIMSVIIYIQIAKIFEYQADSYAARMMDNPKGMISGNIKMRDANKGFLSNPIIRHLLAIAVPYEERIKLAEKYMPHKSK